MRIAALLTGFVSVLSVASAVAVTPSSDIMEVSVVERSFISDVIGEVGDFFDGLTVEGVAGTVNDWLVNDGLINILESVLVGVRETELIPDAILFLLNYNITRSITGFVLQEGLSLLSSHNATPLFVALDQSGLAYSIVAGAIEDPDFFPSVIEIVSKLLASDSISIGGLFGSNTTLARREELLLGNGVRPVSRIKARDNVDDLITTVFTAVAASGLINDTIHELIINPTFQDDLVEILSGWLSDFSFLAILNGLSSYRSLLVSLWDSGLLLHIIERAFTDSTLIRALGNDIANIVKRGDLDINDLTDDVEKRQLAFELLGLGPYQVEQKEKSSALITKSSSLSKTKTTSIKSSTKTSKSLKSTSHSSTHTVSSSSVALAGPSQYASRGLLVFPILALMAF